MNVELAVRQDLRELVDSYALAVDRADGEMLGRLFTPGANLEIYEAGADEPALVYRGTGEIQSVVGLVGRFAGTFHLVANHCVVLGEHGRATGTTYCLAHHLSADETRDTQMLIRYQDDYVRESGRWCFARRRVMRQWNNTLAADRSPLAAG